MTKTRLDALQVLRFLAAMLVVVGHAQHELVDTVGPAAGSLAFILLDWGLGVDVFFVISGFVMYYLMRGRFGGRGVAADFLRRRLIRIVPLYWIFTSLVLAVALAEGIDYPMSKIVSSYLFLPPPSCPAPCPIGYDFPVYSLGWTLNFEMMFYLVFAVGLLMRKRAGLAFVVVVIATLVALVNTFHVGASMLRFWGDSIALEFLMGIGIAALFVGGRRMPAAIGWTLIVSGFVLAAISYQLDAYQTIGRAITGGIPAALIVSGAILRCPIDGASAWNRFLIFGGDASYSLYLAHPVAFKIATPIAAKLGLVAPSPSLYLVSLLVAATIAGFAVHVLLEKPLLYVLNRRWSRFGSTGYGDGQPVPGRSG
ncbi:acyltransferase [Aureimonas sp. AU4]|uniref:acyltransferase family protein n=1 Tax=Aureimonas sp. AU4 TaxID=1638163 RepID=UPI000782A80C|nr:acyltransferase [Aureimonas sp. AU4]